MVTDWANHWDKIKGNRTSYMPDKLATPLPNDKIIENTETIFVKINRKTNIPEKAWIGTVSNFERLGNKLFFNVNINKEVSVPDRYECYVIGWYII